MPKLRAANQSLETAFKTSQNAAIAALNARNAPGFDYARHDTSSKNKQEEMVDDFVIGRIKNDPSIRQAQQRVQAESRVTDATMDLGIIQLRRGQHSNDPAQRRHELENAEKTFLSIRNVASRSEIYQLSLGQVYYWLGKHAEGRKVFDDLLKTDNRSSNMLVAVGHILREVGEVSQARTVVEEAHAKETDMQKKYGAALFRSVLFKDLDDEIDWLARANPNDLQVKASLAKASGYKALQEGKDADAAKHFRDAINTYGQMNEDAGSLNNCASCM